jgi:hypothetical protein
MILLIKNMVYFHKSIWKEYLKAIAEKQDYTAGLKYFQTITLYVKGID